MPPKRERACPASRLQDALSGALGAPFPLAVRAWDGSRAGPAERPALVFVRRRALRRLLWSPGELGLARGYVSGDLEVEGDLHEALRLILAASADAGRPVDSRAGVARAVLRAVQLGALGPPPTPPPEEVRRRWGVRHSPRRDAAAISHHYDVGNDFYRLVLGPSMVYSCAYWTGEGPGYGLEDAQEDKLDLVARKLSLRPGMRLLDVGCGWGSLAIHVARVHGVCAVGITISQQQAQLARARVRELGLEHLVEIRLQDYRDVDDGPFDVVSSIGMAEHVGGRQLRVYSDSLFRLLRPGGRLLHHAIAAQPGRGDGIRPFVDAYVFPDGELLRLGTTVTVLQDAGFEVRDVQSLREHYVPTLRAWVANLEQHWDEAVASVGTGRARTWRLYMSGAATSFETGRTGVDQIVAVVPDAGDSGMPMVRESWLGGPDGRRRRRGSVPPVRGFPA